MNEILIFQVDKMDEPTSDIKKLPISILKKYINYQDKNDFEEIMYFDIFFKFKDLDMEYERRMKEIRNKKINQILK